MEADAAVLVRLVKVAQTRNHSGSLGTWKQYSQVSWF